MSNNIKKVIGLILIMFSLVALVIAMLTIWQVVDNVMAKDLIVKTAYTFGLMLVFSAIILLITKISDKK